MAKNKDRPRKEPKKLAGDFKLGERKLDFWVKHQTHPQITMFRLSRALRQRERREEARLAA